MRIIYLLAICIFFIQNNQASPLYHPKQEGTTINNSDKKGTCIFKSLSKKEIEKKLGRKLKLKEKVALFFLKRKLIKTVKLEDPEDRNVLFACILMALGLLIGFLFFNNLLIALLAAILTPALLGFIVGVIVKDIDALWDGFIASILNAIAIGLYLLIDYYRIE